MTVAVDRAEPTGARVHHLESIVADASNRDSIECILDDWNDLDGTAATAAGLYQALDRWRHWADGHDVSRDELTQIAMTLHANSDTPGAVELADELLQRESIDLVAVDRELSQGLEFDLGMDL